MVSEFLSVSSKRNGAAPSAMAAHARHCTRSTRAKANVLRSRGNMLKQFMAVRLNGYIKLLPLRPVIARVSTRRVFFSAAQAAVWVARGERSHSNIPLDMNTSQYSVLRPNSTRAPGFTLIELLVVIAIIAILAG